MTSILSVVIQYTCFSQRCINTFHYLNEDLTPPTTGLAYALTEAMGAIPVAGVYPAAGLIRQIASCVQAAVNFDQIIVKDIYNVLDFYETAFTTALVGEGAGETLSPAMALGFKTTRVRSDIKRGTRRFVGIAEANVGSGGILLPGYLSGDVQQLADAMSANIVGNTPAAEAQTFIPIVVGKEKYLPPGNVAPNYAYKYYATETEQLNHIAQGIEWFAYDQIRTQVSRQYGRGQ